MILGQKRYSSSSNGLGFYHNVYITLDLSIDILNTTILSIMST